MTEIHPTDGPIHTWFGLSYSNYLVLPRTLMQSMPIEWQERMVACLEELHDAFRQVPQAEGYDVIPGTVHIVDEMGFDLLAEAGITEDWYGGQTPPEGLSEDDLHEWKVVNENESPTYYKDGREMNPNERVVLPEADPVPHYNRGRTYIEPQIRATVPKPRDRFAVVYEEPTKVNSAVVADEIRCMDCQSITGMAGVFEPTLAQINAMADRHECLPRVSKED